ncbi:MAG TPA: site-2 protease family protein [Candidatus Sulfotelmatobacter sp.]|nr:site-2 protease family protein [Candidatus Sulfotelmatobacter sp.]HWI56346.1 site-2 protease family protein [Bacillota bacterium]
MRWSWQIGRVAGIAIYVHVTFFLLLLWIGASHFSVRHSWSDAWGGIAFILLLFVIVVLHELGHALTARRFGIRTRDITLLPIGGVARLERMPEEPKQELLVALAGPAVNVCLAVLLFAILGAGRQLADLANVGMVGGNFLASLMWVNVALAVFNLVPAFPMDGGRVLRALLATRLSYVRATNIAAYVGQTIALGFGFLGLSSFFFGAGAFSNPFLVFIALFVWVGAAQEAGLVQMRSALGDVSVSQLMITDFRSLTPREPLARAVELLLAGWQHDFPVLEEGRVVGLLTRQGLVNGLAQLGRNAPVIECMARQFATVNPAETAEAVLVRLRTGEDQTMLVTKDGTLLGILASENLGEYLMIQAALRGEAEARKWGARVIERQAA